MVSEKKRMSLLYRSLKANYKRNRSDQKDLKDLNPGHKRSHHFKEIERKTE